MNLVVGVTREHWASRGMMLQEKIKSKMSSALMKGGMEQKDALMMNES